MRLAIFVLALAVFAAPLVWRFSAPSPGPAPAALEAAGLNARLTHIEQEFEALAETVEELERRVAAMQGDFSDLPPEPPSTTDFGGFDELMLLGSRGEINSGLTALGVSELVEAFGVPAPGLDQQCAEPTSERLLQALEIRDVGPFRARMIKPALDSLERIMERVRSEYPTLYDALKTYGGFCARLIRGSRESISRHAFGVALDVSIGGTLDEMGDGFTQFGLIILNDFFAEEQWYWGAAFSREDSMHFEVSRELFQKWREEGLI